MLLAVASLMAMKNSAPLLNELCGLRMQRGSRAIALGLAGGYFFLAHALVRVGLNGVCPFAALAIKALKGTEGSLSGSSGLA